MSSPRIFGLFILQSLAITLSASTAPTVEGWNVLSDHPGIAERAIVAAGEYGINHLQISHRLIMDLHQAREPVRASRINSLVDMAHSSGISEVCIWDHALYGKEYYPERFRTAPGGRIDLDNPEFWSWIKQDYREMLDLLPEIDGLVLTFIETGTHVEDQYSEQMLTESEKLAKLVKTLASVIIDERNLVLYIRTFVYTRSELDSMLACINSIDHPGLRVMTKEVPHDFFLTHPTSRFVEKIKFPTIIEFDAAHEYNGQSVIASAFPETHLKRWNYYKTLPNVIGYVARTDRYGETSIIDGLAELNLFALHRAMRDNETNPARLVDAFVARIYGPDNERLIARAVETAAEVVPSTLYTLGLCLSTHSRLELNNGAGVQRHVSGKWMQVPEVHIGHGINRTFHYWRDLVNTLAEPRFKVGNGRSSLSRESPWVFEQDWLAPGELMNETYLRYILTEKAYGLSKSEEAIRLVDAAIEKYEGANPVSLMKLKATLERTLLTARLYQATAKLYFGYRVFSRGLDFQSPFVKQTLEESLKEIPAAAFAILNHPDKGPLGGQYNWEEDAFRALAYYNAVNQRSSDIPAETLFINFPFSGLSADQKAAILKQYKAIRASCP